MPSFVFVCIFDFLHTLQRGKEQQYRIYQGVLGIVPDLDNLLVKGDTVEASRVAKLVSVAYFASVSCLFTCIQIESMRDWERKD